MSRDQTIRELAFAIWEAEGKPEGRQQAHWAEAERRISESIADSAKSTVPAEGGSAPEKPGAREPAAKPVARKAVKKPDALPAPKAPRKSTRTPKS